MIEPDEKEDKIGDISEKVGNLVLSQSNMKGLKGLGIKIPKPKKSAKKAKDPKEVVRELMPLGDDKSVRRTIGGAIIVLCIIAAISLAISAIALTTDTIFGEFGFIGGFIALIIGIGIPTGIVAFFISTANKEEKESHIEERFK